MKEMAGPHPKDDDLPVRAAVFASGRTALKSIVSVSTPDHLWRALNASPIPTLDRRLQRRFARRITKRGATPHHRRAAGASSPVRGHRSASPRRQSRLDGPTAAPIALDVPVTAPVMWCSSCRLHHQAQVRGTEEADMELTRRRRHVILASVFVAGLGYLRPPSQITSTASFINEGLTAPSWCRPTMTRMCGSSSPTGRK